MYRLSREPLAFWLGQLLALAWNTPASAVAGRCVDNCPMTLVPTQLSRYVKFDDLTSAEKWGVLDCVECGCCQYICPSKIPLVHWIRVGKNRIIALKQKKSA